MFQENQTSPSGNENPVPQTGAEDQQSQASNQAQEPQEPQAQDAQAAQVPQSNVDSGEKLFSALCYLPVFSILLAPLAINKYPKSAFVTLHASNGLGIFALWFVSIFLALFPPLIGSIVWLLLLVVSVWGGVSAFSGKELSIPLVHSIGVLLLNAIKPLLGQVSKVTDAAGTMVSNQVNQMNQSASASLSEKPEETSAAAPTNDQADASGAMTPEEEKPVATQQSDQRGSEQAPTANSEPVSEDKKDQDSGSAA